MIVNENNLKEEKHISDPILRIRSRFVTNSQILQAYQSGWFNEILFIIIDPSKVKWKCQCSVCKSIN